MADASDLTIGGTVFKNGSAVLLARVVDATGEILLPEALGNATYSIARLAPNDPDAETPITPHTDIDVPVAELISDTLQVDDAWRVDTTGYNFRHELDVSTDQAFPTAGVAYRITFRLAPVEGQIILVRFRVHAV